MAREVLIAGETLIDFLPERPGPLSRVGGFERRPGGAPANVAAGLARLGSPPLFWTRVGDDHFGRYLRETLREEGIPDRFVELDSGAKTTLAFVTRDEDGDRAFTFYRENAADTRLEPGRIDDATLAELEWVHAGGVALSSGRSRAATLDLLERAVDRDCTVSFDPNYRPELWPDVGTFRRNVRDALEHVDVLKATRGEFEALGFAGETPEALAQDALAAGLIDAPTTGPRVTFLTRRSEGAIAVADGSFAAASDGDPWTGTAKHPGYPVEAVDATGAGDAFVAGTIAAAFDGRDLAETLAFANAVAAAATTATGAMAALPTREVVRERFDSPSG